MAQRVSLSKIEYNSHRIAIFYQVDDQTFSTTIWYDGLDLKVLADSVGKKFFKKLLFHIAAFDLLKFLSLKPTEVSFGRYQCFASQPFIDLWTTVFKNVWAQWRFENNLPLDKGPSIPAACLKPNNQILVGGKKESALVLNGGGKDSLLSINLMNKMHIPFKTLSYSSSIYGNSQIQHKLTDKVASFAKSLGHIRMWITDDFSDSPVLRFEKSGIQTLCAAETPFSIFTILPIMLHEDFRYVVLGHEKSADVGNIYWDAEKTEVNHQWGKSLEAENLLAKYIREQLITGIQYFSILKPISDVVIFNLLEDSRENLIHTNSCNIQKPWCEKCPKCAYVWLSFMAHYGEVLAKKVFKSNLLEHPDNQEHFERMIGIRDHTPFECIGTIEESRFALELLHIQSPSIESKKLLSLARDQGVPDSMKKAFSINFPDNFPSDFKERLNPIYEQAAKTIRKKYKNRMNLSKVCENKKLLR